MCHLLIFSYTLMFTFCISVCTCTLGTSIKDVSFLERGCSKSPMQYVVKSVLSNVLLPGRKFILCMDFRGVFFQVKCVYNMYLDIHAYSENNTHIHLLLPTKALVALSRNANNSSTLEAAGKILVQIA